MRRICASSVSSSPSEQQVPSLSLQPGPEVRAVAGIGAPALELPATNTLTPPAAAPHHLHPQAVPWEHYQAVQERPASTIDTPGEPG